MRWFATQLNILSSITGFLVGYVTHDIVCHITGTRRRERGQAHR